MSEQQNGVCDMKHQRVDEILEDHERRLTGVEHDSEKQKVSIARSEVSITNLCDQIKSLVSIIKWYFGLTFATMLTFIVWYIQNLGGK